MVWIKIIISIIYASFILDLVVWPIGSEASAISLGSEKGRGFITSLRVWSQFLVCLISYLAPLMLVGMSLVLNLDYFNDFAWQLAGIFLAISGRVLSLTGTRVMKKYQSSGMVKQSVFQYSRNPITTGMHITLLGFCLCFSLWLLWIGFLYYLWYMHQKIKIEEGFLVKLYSTDYQYYINNTPRYLWK